MEKRTTGVGEGAGDFFVGQLMGRGYRDAGQGKTNGGVCQNFARNLNS